MDTARSLSDNPDQPRAALFKIGGAEPLTIAPSQHGQAGLGSLGGKVYGIVSGPVGLLVGAMTDRELMIHSLISSIQTCFLGDDFVMLLDTEPVDLDQVFEDLTWLFPTPGEQAASIRVGEVAVDCLAITYRGVRFAAGREQRRWPFVVARSADIPAAQAWPALTFSRG